MKTIIRYYLLPLKYLQLVNTKQNLIWRICINLIIEYDYNTEIKEKGLIILNIIQQFQNEKIVLTGKLLEKNKIKHFLLLLLSLRKKKKKHSNNSEN